MNTDEAVKSLKSHGEPLERRSAAETLAAEKAFTVDAIEALACGLLDHDSGVKDICARILAALTEENAAKAADFLAPMIAHKDIETRNLAGDILVSLKSVSVDALLPMLSDEHVDVRKFTCDLIGLVGDASLTDHVISLLEDKDANVRASAVETLGNFGSLLSIQHLLDLYASDEALKLNIIDAAGKIGGSQAQSFLVDILKSEEDLFLKTTCIDALALCGEDMEYCRLLLELLPSQPSQVQLIILKTIYAIAYRLEEELPLPAELRYIAHAALFDDDPDVRIAGVLALGKQYIDEDLPGLINEIKANNPDTQELILVNLLCGSSCETVEAFFSSIHDEKYNNGTSVDLFSMLLLAWDSSTTENANVAIKTIFNQLFINRTQNLIESIEFLLKLAPSVICEELKMYLFNGSNGQIEDALDVIGILSLKELAADIEKFIETNNEFANKAKNILYQILLK